MRFALAGTLVVLSAAAVFAQNDRGTMTGTIVDSTGAVIANAPVEARNTDTGALYPAASSETGNYTVVQLPAGPYELDVTVAGFKKFIRTGLTIQAAQTIRVDATLEVGNATDAITVEGEAPQLQTESGELSNTIATQTKET